MAPSPLDPMNLYDPRLTTGLAPVRDRPKHGTPLKGLLIVLVVLIVLLAGASWLMFGVILPGSEPVS